jgi:hypothetical protein
MNAMTAALMGHRKCTSILIGTSLLIADGVVVVKAQETSN